MLSRYLNNSTTGFALYGVSVLLGFYNTRIFIKTFSVEQYSSYALILNVAEPVYVLSTFGLTTYIVKNLTKKIGPRFLLKTHALIIICIAVISGIYFTYSNLGLLPVLIILGFALLKLSAGISRLKKNLWIHWFLKYLGRPLALYVSLIFLSSQTLSHVFVAQSVIMLVFVILGYIMIRDLFVGLEEEEGLFTGIRNATGFLISSIPPIALSYFDKLYLVEWLSEEQYSIYSVVFRLSLFVGLPLVIFNSVLTRLFLNSPPDKIRKLFFTYRWRGFFLGLLIFIALLLALPLICKFLLIPCGTDTYVYFFIMSAVQLISLFFGSSALLLSLKGFEKYVGKYLSIVAISQILAIIVLVQFGVFYAILCPVVFSFVWNYICFRKSHVEILK